MTEQPAAPGHARVTRADWIAAAMERLVADGAGAVKIKPLAERLGVSRSSFYWYFRDRQDLLDGLLAHWQAVNTAALVRQAERPAPTITAAVCNVFRCAVNPALFDPGLDLTVRDWARRSAPVRAAVDRSDAARMAALAAMFARHGYAEEDAETRARILYYMQIGYYATEPSEPIEARLRLLRPYLVAFTGQEPPEAEVAEFRRYARTVAR